MIPDSTTYHTSKDELQKLFDTSLDPKDYGSSLGLDIESSQAWNQLVQDLPQFLNEIAKIPSITAKGPKELLGVELEGIHPQNPRLSILEQASSISFL